jgi:hypothetical protein
MKTGSSSFAVAILLTTAACGHHHVNPPAQPYVDRSIWVEPTSGCNETSPKSLPKFRASDTLSSNSVSNDPQAHTAWLARRVPGGLAFGRAFDDNHHPIIRLTDPTQKLAALATLDTLAPSNGKPRAASADSVLAIRVRWDFAELYDWMWYLTNASSDVRGLGINSGGIDTHNDRIEFGVEKREAVPGLVSWLIGRGVPCRLVAVRVIGPIRGI